MPVQFTFFKDKNYVLAELTGTLIDEELLDTYETLYQHADWRLGMNELVDMRAADMRRITAAGLRKLMHLTERYATEKFRTAIVATDDLPYGLARIYQVISESSPEEVSVFRNMSQARYWLGLGREQDLEQDSEQAAEKTESQNNVIQSFQACFA